MQHGAGKIRVLDNLSTGNLDNIQQFIGAGRIEFIEGDIRSYVGCISAMENIDFVSHQAALGSVPRSIKDPLTSNDVNISGYLNVLTAAKEGKVKRMVYAASSSTYGDSQSLPKLEDIIGKPLSPYAVTKYVNELYGNVFSDVYGFHSIGLRYFNVFGPKQNLNGAYAAVVPLFVSSILKDESPFINGTGENSRDFTFVSNAVQANIKALLKENISTHTVYNIACGEQTSLLGLIASINHNLGKQIKPTFRNYREGDIMHSLADINKARKEINYNPEVMFNEGIKQTISFFQQQM